MEPAGKRKRPTSMNIFTTQTRTRHKAGVAAVVGAVVVLAACSQGASTGPGLNSDKTPRPQSSLTIRVTAAHGATPHTWTLTCSPAGGTHPHPQTACATLSTVKDPFAPVPPHTMCTMIFSGPQTASITGTWDGERVSASYARDNGCQTARWDKLGSVLDGIDPGGPMIPASGNTP
jgi:Subtilisin inhibitor-like